MMFDPIELREKREKERFKPSVDGLGLDESEGAPAEGEEEHMKDIMDVLDTVEEEIKKNKKYKE